MADIYESAESLLSSVSRCQPKDEFDYPEIGEGEAKIKKEYMVPLSVLKAQRSKTVEDADGSSKAKGVNKKRPRDSATDQLCSAIARGDECRFGENCKFDHNVASYLARKPSDLLPTCRIFDLTGYCPAGLNCRFSRAHSSTDGRLLFKSKEERTLLPSELNLLSHKLQAQLRSKKYAFHFAPLLSKESKGKSKSKSKIPVNTEDAQITTTNHNQDPQDEVQILKEIDGSHTQITEKLHDAHQEAKIDADGPTNNSITQNIGFVVAESYGNSRDQSYRPVDFSRKVYIAPLTTVGNLPFRRICKDLGADITCGEMAMCTSLLQGQTSEWALLRRHPCEDIFGVQIAGSDTQGMMRLTEVLENETRVDFVDLNMGCPIDNVCRKGMGAAFMNRTRRFEEMYKGVAPILSCPFTIKMRTGYNDNKVLAPDLVAKLQKWGAEIGRSPGAITIHGRSRLQRYHRSANWDIIQDCINAQDPELPRVPIIGNGDIFDFEDWEYRIQQGVDTCLIGRGALVKPWISTEIKERRHWDISASERLDLLKDYVNYGLEHWGSDQKGVNTTRRFLLEWLSFLHRYIPVGLLEVLPQRHNERPTAYYGRNDLETLFASENSDDWIRISTMLLGPVPSDFKFEPKHKAKSYSPGFSALNAVESVKNETIDS